jgi:hypothetical protein
MDQPAEINQSAEGERAVLTVTEEFDSLAEKASMAKGVIGLNTRSKIVRMADLAQSLLNGTEDREKELRNIALASKAMLFMVERELKRENGNPRKWLPALEGKVASSLARLEGIKKEGGNGLHDKTVQSNNWWKIQKS